MGTRRILHMDMDAFFAAVEERRRPELRGRPVVIGGGGDPTKRGVVSTANYQARKYGVHSAMPLRTAHKLCPQAVFLPVDYREYSRVSRIIKGILRQASPVMEDVGIDEAFLDITDVPGSPEEIARDVKRRIREATGLTCSIGVAHNKLLAKIGSDLEKPDGLTVIRRDRVGEVLGGLPVRKLRGVGPKTEELLKKMGIATIGDLAARPMEELVGAFGPSHGGYLYEAARGMDESPLVTEWTPKSSSRETTFQEDVADWQALARTLARLVEEVVADMREMGFKGRTATVKVRFSDFRTLTRAKTVPEASDSLEDLRRAAFEAFGRCDLKGRKVRLIGFRMSGFEQKDVAH
ncbi:MAG: DNA polymerase IV [Nitrospirota bacterium]